MARKLPIPNGRLDGALDANGMRIVNLMDPMSGDDAATKKYVDGRMAKDGLSAYEVAVRNGFAGTEEEWLASLKGKDGKGSGIAESASKPGQAARADHADNAYTADKAKNAESANIAEHASNATDATNAVNAECDSEGNKISQTYAKSSNYVELSGEFEDGTAFSILAITKGA